MTANRLDLCDKGSGCDSKSAHHRISHPKLLNVLRYRAPVVQLDRTSDYESHRPQQFHTVAATFVQFRAPTFRQLEVGL